METPILEERQIENTLTRFLPGELVLWTSHKGENKAGFIIGEAEPGLTQWFYNVGGFWLPESQLTAI